MKNRIVLGILAVVFGVYVIAPDPFPVVIDDVIAGLICAANILRIFKLKGLGGSDQTDTKEIAGEIDTDDQR